MEKKSKILVVGSIAMDLIIETADFPDSGETVFGKSFQTAGGGKGANQAVQAAKLGADVTMAGKVGDDEFGKTLLGSLKSFNVNTSFVLTNPNAATAIANIILEVSENKGTENRIIVASGANMTITKDDIAFLETEISKYDIVVLQLEIPMEINEFVANVAYRNNVPVMLNCAPAAPVPDELLSKLTYICPNEHEAYKLTGIKIKTTQDSVALDDVKAAAGQLLEKGVKNVIITLGDKGAAMLNNAQFIYLECINAGKTVDPTAAGDSFVGAFCYSISIGKTIKESMEFANATAAITVTKMGAQPSLPTMQEFMEIYNK